MKLRRNNNSILPDLIFSKFFLVFFVILFLVVLFGLAKGTVKNYQVDSEIVELQKDISQLEKQNQEFKQLVNYLETDSFVEQEAKLKMGYKKPGENLVIIPQEETTEQNIIFNEYQQLSNPAKWWAYFFLNRLWKKK